MTRDMPRGAAAAGSVRPRRRWWRLLVLAATSLTVSFALVELGLRLVWQPWSLRSHRLLQASEEYGWAPRPGITGVAATPEYQHFATNSAQGLRGATVFAAERPAGVRARLLLLGDSFTYGLGAADDETFAAGLQRLAPDCEVVNSGANGYCTRECLAVLDHLGAALRPDLAVYVFFWNDLDDNLTRKAPEFAIEQGKVVRTDRARPTSDPLALRPAGVLESEAPALYLHELLRSGLQALRYRLFGIRQRAVHTPELKVEALQHTERLLAIMQARSKEIGSRLVVVCLPDHNQVDPAAQISGIGPLQFDVQEPLAAICSRLGIAFVDLLPGLRERWQQAGEPFYYYADRHLTPAGNRAVAELMHTELARLLPHR